MAQRTTALPGEIMPPQRGFLRGPSGSGNGAHLTTVAVSVNDAYLDESTDPHYLIRHVFSQPSPETERSRELERRWRSLVDDTQAWDQFLGLTRHLAVDKSQDGLCRTVLSVVIVHFSIDDPLYSDGIVQGLRVLGYRPADFDRIKAADPHGTLDYLRTVRTTAHRDTTEDLRQGVLSGMQNRYSMSAATVATPPPAQYSHHDAAAVSDYNGQLSTGTPTFDEASRSAYPLRAGDPTLCQNRIPAFTGLEQYRISSLPIINEPSVYSETIAMDYSLIDFDQGRLNLHAAPTAPTGAPPFEPSSQVSVGPSYRPNPLSPFRQAEDTVDHSGLGILPRPLTGSARTLLSPNYQPPVSSPYAVGGFANWGHEEVDSAWSAGSGTGAGSGTDAPSSISPADYIREERDRLRRKNTAKKGRRTR